MTTTTKRPLTKADLLAACDLAERAIEQPVEVNGCTRLYDQREWDCGTACCIHGFASLHAGNGHATEGPQCDDYGDLPGEVRNGVLSVLWSTGGTPALVRRVLSGELEIGKGVKIPPGTVVTQDMFAE